MQQILSTPFGPLVAVWNDRGLVCLHFSDAQDVIASASQEADGSESVSAKVKQWQTQLAAELEQFFAGGKLTFPLDLCDLSDVPEFHRKVLAACYAIPQGRTLTYGELATQVGSPGAARAVGQAMAKNRWPIVIPCHRVVGHSGKLTGYSGRGGTETKRALIDFEAGRQSLLFEV